MELLRARSDATRTAWHLLAMVRALETAMYSCHSGDQVGHVWPRPAMAFLLQNRQVCDEWLLHNREGLLRLAFASGAYAAAVEHGIARLHDLHGT